MLKKGTYCLVPALCLDNLPPAGETSQGEGLEISRQ